MFLRKRFTSFSSSSASFNCLQPCKRPVPGLRRGFKWCLNLGPSFERRNMNVVIRILFLRVLASMYPPSIWWNIQFSEHSSSGNGNESEPCSSPPSPSSPEWRRCLRSRGNIHTRNRERTVKHVVEISLCVIPARSTGQHSTEGSFVNLEGVLPLFAYLRLSATSGRWSTVLDRQLSPQSRVPICFCCPTENDTLHCTR